MEQLTEKITKMLNGEKKRRAVAEKFLEVISQELTEVCAELYGEGADDTNAVTVSGYDDYRDIYFRYKEHHGDTEAEPIGFYIGHVPYYWGTPVSEFRGRDFWIAIREIHEWLTERLPDRIAEIEAAREKTTEKITKILAAAE